VRWLLFSSILAAPSLGLADPVPHCSGTSDCAGTALAAAVPRLLDFFMSRSAPGPQYRPSPEWAYWKLPSPEAEDAMKRDIGQWMELRALGLTFDGFEAWRRERDMASVIAAAPRFWFPSKQAPRL